MFVGHYGVGFALKAVERNLSLGWLFLAVSLSDILLWFFIVSGFEHAEIVPGFTRSVPLNFYDVPLSHGVATSLVWAFITYGLTVALYHRKKYQTVSPRKAGLVMATAVFSHIILDILVHIPDISLFPSTQGQLGLGLYNFPILSNLIEMILLAIGFMVYCSCIRPKTRAAKLTVSLFLVFLSILQLLRGLSGIPRNLMTLATINLTFLFGIVLLAFWVERNR